MNYNSITVTGRLTKDPIVETKSVKGEDVPLCVFTVASNRHKEDVDFFPVSVWRTPAKLAGTILKKGSHVLIRGNLKTTRKEDKTFFEISADEFVALENKQKTDA